MKTHAPGAIGMVSQEKGMMPGVSRLLTAQGTERATFLTAEGVVRATFGIPRLVVAFTPPGNACNNEMAPFPLGLNADHGSLITPAVFRFPFSWV
ncbi:hypothetical protein GCM10023213_12530 [Prosthecobacter algae]|uniref:Uncharacterized protein n=1 Tax=Prosthecobacter algae TaxID=1144682 RepID=A0ABP9NYM9_9BACT